MAKDIYSDFETLSRHEKSGKDYRILIHDIGSPVTIIAPHGGKIEPHTSDIARAIAGGRYNCYCFEGLKADHNGRLHITSHRFDEPRAIELLGRSEHVLAIHACTGTEKTVYIGGLDETLKRAIADELKAKGIKAAIGSPRFGGMHADNLCNRGLSKKGVQLEITRDLRDDREKIEIIAAAVRSALKNLIV